MAASPAQIALKNERMDQVAELLSIGLDRAEIAERLGFSIRNFDKYLQSIRERLGAQAV